MNDDLKMREHLSALADGQLRGQDFAQAVDHASSGDGVATWQMYHLIGDVLRSSELARPVDSTLIDRLRTQIEEERVERPAMVAEAAVLKVAMQEAVKPAVAANASVFRWKMAAGFASLAAVGAIGWTALVGIQSNNQGGQMALVAPVTAAPAVVAVAEGGDTAAQTPVMIRDPRLDELLAAHKQFGNTSALQMPAGFLRNATFEAPAR
ncbi:sigma-E factor negative regulatory protein [Acidovorax sp. SUPP3334]|uniref:sigma-E factor negative regulatory protein n=1 Tax=Acidovorax sp. SUPP3334 TaxID=2920881 RepID=UPI0023DE56E5|nr:sigma-E factor negative regulatory protein [Acidovorax sp. SUPP3334]GKT22265.1 sigma-E factor negative regulatory protein [Acidovorax sp. SUPP3334]